MIKKIFPRTPMVVLVTLRRAPKEIREILFIEIDSAFWGFKSRKSVNGEGLEDMFD